MQATLERLRDRREERGDEGGFTLIELLIVIVILGILAAIVVFAVQNLTGQSANSACQADYKTVETAAEAYKAQIGSYPASVVAMTTTASPPGSAAVDGPWLKDNVTSSHYMIADAGGVITVTPTGGTAVTGAASAQAACVGVTS